jgi:Putative restriction endonuclease
MISTAILPSETRTLPTHLDLPFEDKTVPHNFFELRQAMLLTSAIEFWLERRRPGFECEIGQHNYIYCDNTTPPTAGAKAPDWFLVPGVPRLLDGVQRNSYVMWQEKVVPAVVAEFVSEEPGGEWDKTPRTGKFWVYEQGIRVPHYVIFDPWRDQLDAYQLVDGRFQPAQSNERGHYSIDSLGLEYGLWKGIWQSIDRRWLRFWDNQGQMLLTHAEAEEQARLRADQAELAKQQAFAKLRELGFDPEKLP